MALSPFALPSPSHPLGNTAASLLALHVLDGLSWGITDYTDKAKLPQII